MRADGPSEERVKVKKSSWRIYEKLNSKFNGPLSFVSWLGFFFIYFFIKMLYNNSRLNDGWAIKAPYSFSIAIEYQWRWLWNNTRKKFHGYNLLRSRLIKTIIFVLLCLSLHFPTFKADIVEFPPNRLDNAKITINFIPQLFEKNQNARNNFLPQMIDFQFFMGFVSRST